MVTHWQVYIPRRRIHTARPFYTTNHVRGLPRYSFRDYIGLRRVLRDFTWDPQQCLQSSVCKVSTPPGLNAGTSRLVHPYDPSRHLLCLNALMLRYFVTCSQPIHEK